jgi:sugar phosphate isomerase/epimerase
VFAISNHLVGQCICDNIDQRHKSILSPEIWGDGEPEGVKQRAAQNMIDAARAAKKLGIGVVNGFTGSSIWHLLYSFPPVSKDMIDAGYADFAKRFKPILKAFKEEGIKFGLEVHPTEIAFDIASAQRAIDAVRGHECFGFNYDPSHLGYQGVDYVKFIRTFGKRIWHCHMKDVWWGHGDGTVGVFGGHIDFADPRRYWDFRSIGHGDINFEEIIVALNDVGYQGPLSGWTASTERRKPASSSRRLTSSRLRWLSTRLSRRNSHNYSEARTLRKHPGLTACEEISHREHRDHREERG